MSRNICEVCVVCLISRVFCLVCEESASEND